MITDFRMLSLLCSLSAIFIILGFFLTKIPILAQILILLIGLGLGIYTFVCLIALFIKQVKEDKFGQ
ncbi:hypothetical protein [Lysinibacillus sp. 54212]|uniref:hypothetical protein n=1 Tax=Lysinibacillus sp. 54212 TaxID=3119829 RepID=UPI002FC97B80